MKKILMALGAGLMISTCCVGYVLKIETDVDRKILMENPPIPDFILVTLYADEGRATKLGEEVFHRRSPYTTDRYKAEPIPSLDMVGPCMDLCCSPVRFTFNLEKITDKLTPSISTRPWYTISFDGTRYISPATQVDKDAWENFCAKIGSTPAGTIIPWATANVPEGFLAANGAVVEINRYPRLFAAIGTTYGGNGTTTFQLPDLRGLFIRGVGGNSAGLGRPQDWQSCIPQDGGYTVPTAVYDARGHLASPKNGAEGQAVNWKVEGAPRIINSSLAGSAETRPVNMALNYVIKY